MIKFLVLFTSILSSCGLLTKGSNLDVLAPSGSIERLNLAPRHYRVQEHCVVILKNAAPNLIASTQSLNESQISQISWIKRISQYRPSDCESFHKRGEIMKDFDSIFSSHSSRIGILLPPVGGNEAAIQTIIDEFKATLKRNGVYKPEDKIIVKRVDKREDLALAAGAELIHMDRVSLLLAVNSVHLQALTKLSDLAQVPLFMINPSSPHSKTVQSMRVYPPIGVLADKLLSYYKGRGVTHATVLYPKGADLDLLELLKKHAGNSVYFMETSYDTSSPQTLLSNIKSATTRMTMIRSKSQAVLILDNFKMVRHIVNMIRSTTADSNIIISGNQQWRSPALVMPREVGLEGAVFVDHIGSYADLPRGLEVPMPESPFFTTAQAASRLDYQLIGHRLGTLALNTVKKNWSRQVIANELQSQKNSWDNYFPVSAPAFNSNRDSSWPAFMFQVEGESIKIIDSI